MGDDNLIIEEVNAASKKSRKNKSTNKSLDIELTDNLARTIYSNLIQYSDADTFFKSGNNIYEPHHLLQVDSIIETLYSEIENIMVSKDENDSYIINNKNQLKNYIEDFINNNMSIKLDANSFVTDYIGELSWNEFETQCRE